MHCSNCPEEALYTYDPPGAVATHFCGTHLPSFLQRSAKSGLLKTTDHFADVRTSALAELRPVADPEPEPEAPAPTKRRRSRKKPVEEPLPEVVEEEAPVEEPAVEEPPAEADSED